MASTAVAVGAQLSLSLSLPQRGAKSLKSRSAAALPRLVSASARLSGTPQQLSTIGASPQDSKKRFSSVIVRASEQYDPSKQADDILKGLQEAWDKTDDKLAISGLAFAGFIVLWASTGLISAIDKLPLIPGFFELVGITFSGWFTYRYLLFKPDREELFKLIDEAKGKITEEEKVEQEQQPAAARETCVRKLGRDDNRESFDWEPEGSIVGEWKGFSDPGPDLKTNGRARPDVAV
ncbi:hypothetical protein R1sor_024435 [Riccia sorocarpa]|uniref:Cyanobacterial aminoacyl-tRNA synthetase CAAD domain-containing protein n=1 Tax=Riccia sorocarpa TaxID=122646 RepID=A0ABD3GSX7_9MARC